MRNFILSKGTQCLGGVSKITSALLGYNFMPCGHPLFSSLPPSRFWLDSMNLELDLSTPSYPYNVCVCVCLFVYSDIPARPASAVNMSYDETMSGRQNPQR